jgi:hypothetical protein
LLVDSGCFEYDSQELRRWAKSARAHNVVIVDGGVQPAGRGGGRVIPVVTLERCERARGRQRVVMRHRLESPGLSYWWSRTVEMRETTLEVVDRIKASRPVSAEQMFYLAALHVTRPRHGREVVVPVGGKVVHLQQQRRHAGGAFVVEFFPVMGPLNQVTESPRLSSKATGRDLVFHVKFSLREIPRSSR